VNKKHAFCVGNNYPGTPAELKGCVNDMLDWAELLASQGYEVQMAHEATKADTLDVLRDLVSKVGWGDRIVFTFSGHGTWVPDRDGDEADGRDEAMVMADFRLGGGHGLLLDDELQEVFGGLRAGASALTLSDSCHSGTVSRFSAAFDQPKTPRFLSPVDLLDDLSDDRAVELERRAASTPRRTSSLVSGCGDLEYSYDASFDGRPNGAFTRTAIDTFRPGISLNAWFKEVRKLLPNDWYPQSPQLTASPYRKYTRAL